MERICSDFINVPAAIARGNSKFQWHESKFWSLPLKPLCFGFLRARCLLSQKPNKGRRGDGKRPVAPVGET